MKYHCIDSSKIEEGKYVICDSEQKAKLLLLGLHKLGYKWGNGGSLKKESFWYPSTKKIAYLFFDVDNKIIQYNISPGGISVGQIIEYGDIVIVKDDETGEIFSYESYYEDKKGKDGSMFGTNLTFGENTDKNITSTFLGIAVKKGDSWRVYDKQKNTLTDVGNVDLGGFPLFIVPTTKLEIGDLIKDDGEYCYVVEVEEGKIKTLSATTGEIKEVVPVNNILGIKFYSKIVAVMDKLFNSENIGNDDEKLMLAMATGSMNGSNDFNKMILPLMLLKDKDHPIEDKENLLTKMMLLSNMNGSNDQNPMMWLLLKDIF